MERLFSKLMAFNTALDIIKTLKDKLQTFEEYCYIIVFLGIGPLLIYNYNLYMISYAFWNNKGGIGKSFLCFIASSEYAHVHSDTDVYVIDLCPQANVSETLLSTSDYDSELGTVLKKSKIRRSIGGYLEARLNSPFQEIESIEDYITQPNKYNKNIPENLYLVCGDNILEIISEAIRQTSQLAIPIKAWSMVLNWVADLTKSLQKRSGDREAVIMIDCNPSFAIYTQLAITAADYLIVPFTPDESSHRAIKNVMALLYGIDLDDPKVNSYARINYHKRAVEEGLRLPLLHSFISNRVTTYDGKESKAFKGISKVIKNTVDEFYNHYRTHFSRRTNLPSKDFLFIPDYHSACVYSSTMGIPLHAIKAGPKDFRGERIQINPAPLDKYRTALESFVSRL